jgi:hypothetical protein
VTSSWDFVVKIIAIPHYNYPNPGISGKSAWINMLIIQLLIILMPQTRVWLFQWPGFTWRMERLRSSLIYFHCSLCVKAKCIAQWSILDCLFDATVSLSLSGLKQINPPTVYNIIIPSRCLEELISSTHSFNMSYLSNINNSSGLQLQC